MSACNAVDFGDGAPTKYYHNILLTPHNLYVYMQNVYTPLSPTVLLKYIYTYLSLFIVCRDILFCTILLPCYVY